MADQHDSNESYETNKRDDTDARMKIQEMIDDLRRKCLVKNLQTWITNLRILF